MSKQLTAFVAVLLFMAWALPAMALTNILTLDPDGLGNLATISVSQADTADLYAEIQQIGVSNMANISQEGSALRAVIGQNGSGNFAEISQAGSNLQAYITQVGTNNYASTTQTGSNQFSYIYQNGTGNRATVVQSN